MTLETESIRAEAAYYFSLFAKQYSGDEWDLHERLHAVYREIELTGTYTHTREELEYGTRVAWRNSTRCIGRLTWQSLLVRDMRHLTTAEEIFESLVEHIQMATNGGKIRPVITLFDPQQQGREGIRIWNDQLLRYAGYRQPDGPPLGDPANMELTDTLIQLGWRGKKERTPFDLLPLAIQIPGQAPLLFELPNDIILEVPIQHPDYPWFADLELKWYALPVISNMCLQVGGISYTAAPFNGFYMGTEIGARNFGDEFRYNLLPTVAQKLGLNIRNNEHLTQRCTITTHDKHLLVGRQHAFHSS